MGENCLEFLLLLSSQLFAVCGLCTDRAPGSGMQSAEPISLVTGLGGAVEINLPPKVLSLRPVTRGLVFLQVMKTVFSNLHTHVLGKRQLPTSLLAFPLCHCYYSTVAF